MKFSTSYLFLLSLVALTSTLRAQQPFYAYSISTLTVQDTVEVMAIKFRLPVSEMEEFWDLWEEEMDDVARGDFDDEGYRTRGEEVELEEDAEKGYTVYTRLQDVHDSIQIKVAFEGPNGFVQRGVEDITLMEAASKRWVTKCFKAFKDEELEEREEAFEDAEDEVKDLRKKIENAQEDIQDKQEKIREREGDIAEARTATANTGEQLAQLRRTLGNLALSQEDEREDIEDDIEKLEDRQEDLHRNVRNWEEDILELEEEIGELRTEISEAEMDLSAANADLTLARDAYHRLRTEIQAYRID